jgi:ABC-type Na+ efflux pump permease subunit
MNRLLIGFGFLVAGGVAFVAWLLPDMARSMATSADYAGPGVAVVIWGMLVGLLGLAALANWLVWRGGQPART